MAIRSISTYEDLLWDSIVKMLGLDTDAPETQDKVRLTYPTGGQPGFEIDEDIVFMRVFTGGGDEYDQQMYPDNTADVNVDVNYTRVITLSLIAYGPNAPDNLERVRVSFITGNQTLDLKKEKIYPRINPSSVARVPEYFEGQWWERADFSIVLYAEENTSIEIEGLASAEVTLINDKDERRTINV